MEVNNNYYKISLSNSIFFILIIAITLFFYLQNSKLKSANNNIKLLQQEIYILKEELNELDSNVDDLESRVDDL